MSPEPYVRGQALTLAALLGVAVTFGAEKLALGCSLVAALLAWGLQLKYRGDVRAAQAAVPRHRERLDLIVAGDARAAFGLGIAVSAFAVWVGDYEQPVGDALRSASIPLLIVAATVYLSSLVDWYVILPRIGGLLGARPCRLSSGEPPTFPRTWRETTRWWYMHRIVAALVLRFGLSYAVALSLSDLLSLGVETRLVASAAVVSFSAYLKAIPAAVREAGHPRLVVGRTVRRRDTHRRVLFTLRIKRRTLLRVPSWKREPTGTPMQREYVFDVSIEGVQLVPVAPREALETVGAQAVDYERDPRRIALREVDAAEPSTPFAGCENACSGISWYCIENPRCFEPK